MLDDISIPFPTIPCPRADADDMSKWRSTETFDEGKSCEELASYRLLRSSRLDLDLLSPQLLMSMFVAMLLYSRCLIKHRARDMYTNVYVRDAQLLARHRSCRSLTKLKCQRVSRFRQISAGGEQHFSDISIQVTKHPHPDFPLSITVIPLLSRAQAQSPSPASHLLQMLDPVPGSSFADFLPKDQSLNDLFSCGTAPITVDTGAPAGRPSQ